MTEQARPELVSAVSAQSHFDSVSTRQHVLAPHWLCGLLHSAPCTTMWQRLMPRIAQCVPPGYTHSPITAAAKPRATDGQT